MVRTPCRRFISLPMDPFFHIHSKLGGPWWFLAPALAASFALASSAVPALGLLLLMGSFARLSMHVLLLWPTGPFRLLWLATALLRCRWLSGLLTLDIKMSPHGLWQAWPSRPLLTFSVSCRFHIRSHAGCALNDLADALAKGAARGAVSADALATTETFWAGVHERVCDWVWLLAPRFRSTPQLPSLSDTGAWTKATCEAPPSTTTDAAVLQPSPDTTQGQGEICCQVLQYNCLSLRGAPAQAMMSAGLRRCSAQLAFFQETRLGLTGVTSNDDYWMLNAPCTPAGVGGCQIWLHRRAPVVSNSTQRWGWDRSSFTIIHASPQLLVATIAAGPFHFGLVSGHAPIADAAETVRNAWWSQLASQVRRVPRGCILLVGVDANARFKHEAPFPPQALSSPPTCCNAAALLEFAAEFDLASQAPVSSTGKLLRTWTSPTGKEALIDYLLWSDGVATRPDYTRYP